MPVLCQASYSDREVLEFSLVNEIASVRDGCGEIIYKKDEDLTSRKDIVHFFVHSLIARRFQVTHRRLHIRMP
jgi:hypothetical protein